MERRGFVWVVTILGVIGFIFAITQTITGLVSSGSTFYKVLIGIEFILTCLGAVFIYNFFMMKKKQSNLWNNITSLLFFIFLFPVVYYDTNARITQRILTTSYRTEPIVAGFVGIIIIIVIWNIFRIYINKHFEK